MDKGVAGEILERTQQIIDRIHDQRKELRLKNISELRKWQTNIATIAFTLTAAVIPFIFSRNGDFDSNWVMAGFFMIFVSGTWASLSIKEILEKEARDLPTLNADYELKLLNKQRAAAYIFSGESTNETELVKAELERIAPEPKNANDSVSFISDITLGLLVYGIYLLAHDLMGSSKIYCAGLYLVPLSFVVIAYSSSRKLKTSNEKYATYVAGRNKHAKDNIKLIKKLNNK